jgi:hypothetical protein
MQYHIIEKLDCGHGVADEGEYDYGFSPGWGHGFGDGYMNGDGGPGRYGLTSGEGWGDGSVYDGIYYGDGNGDNQDNDLSHVFG